MRPFGLHIREAYRAANKAMKNRGVSKVHLYPRERSFLHAPAIWLQAGFAAEAVLPASSSSSTLKWQTGKIRASKTSYHRDLCPAPSSFAFTRPVSNEAIATFVPVRRLPRSGVFIATSINKTNRALSTIFIFIWYLCNICVNYFKTPSIKIEYNCASRYILNYYHKEKKK